MKILKLDTSSGISGDMFLGSMASLLDSEEEIVNLARALGMEEEVEVSFKDVKKNSIKCRKAVVSVKHKPEEHHHSHRHLSQIVKLIHASSISEKAKEISIKIFTLLAEAEAEVHGTSIEKVHFHEVGAHDSIIDIVGAAVLLDVMGEAQVYCSSVRTGRGEVKTDHGMLSVPTPATEILLKGMPTYSGEVEGEMATPTGAAILKYLNPKFVDESLIVQKFSFGAGDKEFPHVNALKVSLCEKVGVGSKVETLVLIQTNLDDTTGEILGADLQEVLIKNGALDVFLTPIVMKKGRPGVKFEVLCKEESKHTLTNLILEHTTSLGVRYIEVERKVLEREIIEVETKYGQVRLKVATLPSGKKRAVPEYEDCKDLAIKLEIPIQEVYLEALTTFKNL